MACLYQLIFPNGKSYIGITKKTAEQRFREHCLKAKNGITEYPPYRGENYGRLPWLTSLGQAIREYGKENVIIKTLVIADDLEYLLELEIKAIKRYQTLDSFLARCSGYNTSKGNCPKEIDYFVKTKKWRLTITPSLPWPPKYFINEAKYVADFDTLKEARRILDEIRKEENHRWTEYIEFMGW